MIEKLVYVASPYAAISCARDEEQRRLYAKKIAIKACRDVKNAGYLPISPVLALCDIYNDKEDRDEVMKICKCMLEGCSYIYVANSAYSKASKGIKEELYFAKSLNITILEI